MVVLDIKALDLALLSLPLGALAAPSSPPGPSGPPTPSGPPVHPVSSQAPGGSQPPSPPPKRPEIKVGPFSTGKKFPKSAPRDPKKVCRVTGAGTGDDSHALYDALKKCNNGGTVVVDGKLTIAKALDLTFLKAIDVAITGSIKFTDDIDYWVANSFKYPFQDSSSFWKWGGEDLNIYGNGVGEIDGSGQLWYKLFPTNSTLLRPILFLTDGLHGAQISGLHMKNSPNWFNLYVDSSDLIISDMNLLAASSDLSITPKNTDGFDTLRADNIILQNSIIHNTDDCVSFKPNTTNMIVQNLSCTGSHGISVGSLGQYYGQVDNVENLYIYNTSMADASDGARLKVWPNRVEGSTALNAGGGLGRVRNVTYDQFRVSNDDNAITIDQCYGQKNLTLCQQHPSKLIMQDVLFKGFSGVTSKKYDPRVGRLVCSAPEVCVNIRATDVSVAPPSGKEPVWVCEGFDSSGLGFKCSAEK